MSRAIELVELVLSLTPAPVRPSGTTLIEAVKRDKEAQTLLEAAVPSLKTLLKGPSTPSAILSAWLGAIPFSGATKAANEALLGRISANAATVDRSLRSLRTVARTML